MICASLKFLIKYNYILKHKKLNLKIKKELSIIFNIKFL